ncbi:MAG: hypothetical protein MMC33_006245 [Icmadophila ericetorum]|nr:hypothetical protein [Icmadophila ericetorum]
MRTPFVTSYFLGLFVTALVYGYPQDNPGAPSSTIAASTTAAGAPTSLIQDICYPTHKDTGDPITKYPCNQLTVLEDACGANPDLPATITAMNIPTADPSQQQECFCKQGGKGFYYFENLVGCWNCETLHGDYQVAFDNYAYVYQLSQAYCEQSPASLGFFDFSSGWSSSLTIDISPHSTPLNVLGTSTQISLYFTTTPIDAPVSNVGFANATAVTSTKESRTLTNSVMDAATKSSTKTNAKTGKKGASSSNVVKSIGATSVNTATSSATPRESANTGAATTTKLGSSAASLQISGALCVVVLSVIYLL